MEYYFLPVSWSFFNTLKYSRERIKVFTSWINGSSLTLARREASLKANASLEMKMWILDVEIYRKMRLNNTITLPRTLHFV
jgi:hypothetical protein